MAKLDTITGTVRLYIQLHMRRVCSTVGQAQVVAVAFSFVFFNGRKLTVGVRENLVSSLRVLIPSRKRRPAGQVNQHKAPLAC